MKIKLFTLLAVLSLLSDNITAQTSSTYSRYGIGDIEYSYSARRAGMGQLGISVADADFINSLNPAGWYKLSKTRIEFSGYYNGIIIKDNNASGYFAETEFAGFAVAFPISSLNGISAAAGLVPFSNVSYLIEQTNEINGSSYKITYEGSGGLSRAFAGASYKLPFDLIIGASFDYYFGNLYYKSGLEFLSSGSLTAKYENKQSPKGIGGTFGFISPDLSGVFNSPSITDFRFGGSVNYFSKLDFDTLITSSTSSLVDTMSFGKTKIEIPPRFMFGFNFIFSNEYLLSLDYSVQAWKNYKVGGLKQENLRNMSKVSAGFEYRPAKELGISLWEQIIWRAGLSFEETQYIINNEGVNQYSVAGGFSLPINPENTLDIGLQYSLRGTTNSGLIKENIFRINFGISFGEIWFIRPEN
jgi:hypothetical protein